MADQPVATTLSLQEIADRLLIQDLLVEEAASIDERDWDRWEAVYTPDALVDWSGNSGAKGDPRGGPGLGRARPQHRELPLPAVPALLHELPDPRRRRPGDLAPPPDHPDLGAVARRRPPDRVLRHLVRRHVRAHPRGLAHQRASRAADLEPQLPPGLRGPRAVTRPRPPPPGVVASSGVPILFGAVSDERLAGWPRRARELPLSYPDVGMTRHGRAPAGYRFDRYEADLGEGAEVFARGGGRPARPGCPSAGSARASRR